MSPRLPALLILLIARPNVIDDATLEVRTSVASEKLPIPIELSPSAVDLDLVQTAFNHLKSNPRMAAEVAGERLKQPDPLPASARAKLLWIMGSGLSLSEEHVAALSALEEGELLARQMDDKKLLRRILRFEAASACETADYTRGRDAALEALQLSEVLNDKTAYVAILHNELANNESALGNLDSASRHLNAVDQIAQEHGDVKLQAMALASLAGLLGRMDRHEDAVTTGRKVLRIGNEESQGLVFAATYANLADSLLRLDRADEAELHLASAIQLCSQSGSDSIRGTVESVSGRLRLMRGDVAAARTHFEASRSIFTSLGDESGVQAADQALRSLSSEADHAIAIARVVAALKDAEIVKDPDLTIALLRDLAEQYASAARWKESAESLRQASELERQLWNDTTNDQVAKLLSNLQGAEQTHQIESLKAKQTAQQLLLVSQKRWISGLAASSVLLLLLVAVITRHLKLKRLAFKQLRAANQEIDGQKRQQLAIERRLAEQQKTESLSLLASGIAHDFNNLLCGIAGLAELGALSAQAKRKDELFREITSTSLKASGLTGQLMQFLGRPADETVPSDVVAVVESSRSLLQSVARSSSPVEIHSTTDSLVAAIDETRLCQVLVNLVSNSADASNDFGQILISITRCVLEAADLPNLTVAADARPGEFCRIVVQDSGSGMTETVRRKLFDPYFSTKAVGRGLGLASVMGIVRACCGCIDVKSEPEQGCRISVFIPVIERSLASTAPTIRRIDPEHRPQRMESSLLILFVDDETLLLDCQSEILERFGCRVLTATSAIEALKIASEHLSDLHCVVTDYSMPDHDGVWLATKLRKLRPNLPVILCTGLGDNELASDQNLSRILAKPFSSQLLISAIRELTGEPEIQRTPPVQRSTDRPVPPRPNPSSTHPPHEPVG